MKAVLKFFVSDDCSVCGAIQTKVAFVGALGPLRSLGGFG